MSPIFHRLVVPTTLLIGVSSAAAQPPMAAAAPTTAAHAEERPEGSDEDSRLRADLVRLEWALAVLAGALPSKDRAERLAATHFLVELASGAATRGPALAGLSAEALRGGASSSLAEAALARLAGGRPAPRLAGDGREARANAVFESLSDGRAERRLSSLHWVADVALSEGLESDPRLLDSLVAALADADPRVASFAYEALGELAGDARLLAGVPKP